MGYQQPKSIDEIVTQQAPVEGPTPSAVAGPAYDPFGLNDEFSTQPSPAVISSPEEDPEIAKRLGSEGVQVEPGSKISFETVQETFGRYASQSADEIKKLQQQLAAAGFTVPLDGFFGPETQKALAEALQEAQQQNLSLDELLAKRPGSTEDSTQAQQEYKSRLEGVYWRIWGEPPPPGYVDRAISSGMNTFEFEYYERSKPSYANSPQYKRAKVGFNIDLARMMGRAL